MHDNDSVPAIASPVGPAGEEPVAAVLAAWDARLSALEAEVSSLRDRLQALERGPSQRALAPSAAVEPPQPVAATAATPAAASAAVHQHDPELALQELLREVFAVALTPEPQDAEGQESLFLRFLDLVHPERKGTPMLEGSLRQYGWRQLRRNAGIYLRDIHDPASYDEVRRDPQVLTRATDRVKVFLRATTRMPTPIILRRAGDVWRIEASSL